MEIILLIFVIISFLAFIFVLINNKFQLTIIKIDKAEEDIDIYIGADCQYYHPEKPGIEWCDDNEPFGYDAVTKLFERLEICLKENR